MKLPAMNLPALQPERPFFKPGWYRGIPDEIYHTSNGTSSSTLKNWLKMAPNEVIYRKLFPKESTDTLELGKLVHALVLEPETADKAYAVKPEFNRRSNIGKAEAAAWEEENKDLIQVSPEQEIQAKMMSESVLSHPEASHLLQDTINESSIYWWYKKRDDEDDRDYKKIVKVRPDALSRCYPMVIDLKTSESSCFDDFQKSVCKYFYHLSAAMYLNGVNQCEQIRNECFPGLYKHFVFIVVSKTPAWDSSAKKMVYNTAVYELDQDALLIGNQLYRYAMMRLHDAKEANFPGIPSGIRQMDLPPWANKIPSI